MCLFKQKKIKWRFMGEKHHAYSISENRQKALFVVRFIFPMWLQCFPAKKQKQKKAKARKMEHKNLSFFPPKILYVTPAYH